MSFCYHCGKPMVLTIPTGDDRQREYCKHCDYVHYSNPRVLVSCIIHSDDKLLWMRRGLEPRRGFWAMPAGYMEQGESLQQAGARELVEETGLVIDPNALKLCVLSSLTFINQVYVVFRCYHQEVALTPPSEETQQLAWLEEADVPWEQLAYPGTEDYMRNFYRQVSTGDFETYLGEFSRHQQGLTRMHDERGARKISMDDEPQAGFPDSSGAARTIPNGDKQ